MRRFRMLRRIDETGVSGVGHVADGVLFDDGTVCLRWRTKTPGTTTFASLEHAKAVHGHDRKTEFSFIDGEHGDSPLISVCMRCTAELELGQWCCDQCGASNCDVAMTKSHAHLLRDLERDRVKALQEKTDELRAWRRFAIRILGALRLRLVIDRYKPIDEAERVQGLRCELTRTTHCISKVDEESDEAYVRRAAEHVTFPTEVIDAASEDWFKNHPEVPSYG
jgi:hypothetical protein